MSEKKTKSYAAEFKESAVKLAVESNKPVTETTRELEVNVKQADPQCSQVPLKAESLRKKGTKLAKPEP